MLLYSVIFRFKNVVLLSFINIMNVDDKSVGWIYSFDVYKYYVVFNQFEKDVFHFICLDIPSASERSQWSRCWWSLSLLLLPSLLQLRALFLTVFNVLKEACGIATGVNDFTHASLFAAFSFTAVKWLQVVKFYICLRQWNIFWQVLLDEIQMCGYNVGERNWSKSQCSDSVDARIFKRRTDYW